MGCWTTGGYVAHGDIPLIRSLVTSSTHRRGTFCWNYARNGQYTVRYWVARNLLKTEEDMKVLESGITKLQSFAWKVTAPQKICHLMWQLITGHVVFNANEMVIPAPQEHSSEELMVISMYNICMVDGSWTSTTEFSGFGCGWKDSFGKIQLMGTRNLRRRETALHSEVEAVQWAMDSMLQHSSCQLIGTNCKDMIAMINEP
ncbi:hypothetical protein F2Q68_00044611 [Brassica cretica]|uniref:RNase H type-1 domain-containing protein n=1 Tax=Brassica cretica TaxID=69181 RepID=A0A8S9LJZ2_BRACR|nr:hypothetical protein F2Q68_00044611 [Brassica cretica]